ncbi:MAG: hydrogenase expression/formation protein HypE [Chitinispirillaceae bacterium]|nr:hydrogenase expression/formation protein HypE [Chitinispirillaceae bacterium]
MKNNVILLSHGSGGRLTRQLIDGIFGAHFANPLLDARTDSSLVDCESGTVAFTTDSFVVQPRFFPGGDIGGLAVCGTVNDLAVSGARPLAMSAAFIIEEGFPMEELDRIAASMAAAAAEACVPIVTGDTKVVNRGMADGLFITTAGIGAVNPRHREIGTAAAVKPGDIIIINGSVGDHGMAILAGRNDLSFKAAVSSDCAPLSGLIQTVLARCDDAVTFMRDATRGGVGTILCELAEMCGRGVSIDEQQIPLRPAVRSMCDMFGFDPLFIANEGKVVMTVRKHAVDAVMAALTSHKYGREAAVIGTVDTTREGRVILETSIGGKRIVAVPAGDQLPRIC